MPLENEVVGFDIRLLVRWLGSQGAKAGLERSKIFTTESLGKIGDGLGLKFAKSTTRLEMIEAVVRAANKRIDRPVEQLMKMSREELVAYFQKVEPEREELLDLLKEIDAIPSKDGRTGLIDFAARELSETGRFIRIASSSGHGSERGANRSEDAASKKSGANG
ncbi:MAG: hypothetical protein ACRENE_12740 [Polyangiaceae bacterium]